MTRRASCLGIAALLVSCASTGSARAQQRFTLIEQPAAPLELVCADTALSRSSFGTSNPEVARLTDAATQAMILGDFEGALSFLDRALGLDGVAPEPLYLRARILHQSGRVRDATVAFCRLLAVSATGAAADEARRRLADARRADTVVVALERAFAAGVEHYAAQRLADAEASFSSVLAARPAAPTASYNRGIVRLSAQQYELGRADLERYLVLARPDSAESERVGAIVQWADAQIGGKTPGAALGLGVLLPGGGQFYTRRPMWGSALLAASGGLIATGFLVKRTTIDCLQPDPDGGCPPEQIASEEIERPLLLPAIGAAAALWVGAAIEAALHARGERRAPAEAMRVGAARIELHVHADAAELRVSIPTGRRR